MRRDIAVLTPEGDTALVVEVKARRGMSRTWAMKLHRNLWAHGLTEGAGYFLLVTPDRSFLWKGRPVGHEDGQPDAEVPTTSLLDASLVEAAARDGQALELLVSGWVSSLVAAAAPDEVPEPARSLVVDSGLYDAVKDGAVLTEAA